jgi:hypothetical protein
VHVQSDQQMAHNQDRQVWDPLTFSQGPIGAKVCVSPEVSPLVLSDAFLCLMVFYSWCALFCGSNVSVLS